MNFYSENKFQETEVNKTYENGMADGSCFQKAGMESPMMMGGCCQPACPVYECPQERVCHRYMCYEVPHIMPCNTRIINHHIYKHTYVPEYTCCEENVCENVYGPRCC